MAASHAVAKVAASKSKKLQLKEHSLKNKSKGVFKFGAGATDLLGQVKPTPKGHARRGSKVNVIKFDEGSESQGSIRQIGGGFESV